MTIEYCRNSFENDAEIKSLAPGQYIRNAEGKTVRVDDAYEQSAQRLAHALQKAADAD